MRTYTNSDAKWWASRTASTKPGKISLQHCKQIADHYESDPKGIKAGRFINLLESSENSGVLTGENKKYERRSRRAVKDLTPQYVFETHQEIEGLLDNAPYIINSPGFVQDILNSKRTTTARVVTLAVGYRRFGIEPFYIKALKPKRDRYKMIQAFVEMNFIEMVGKDTYLRIYRFNADKQAQFKKLADWYFGRKTK